MADEWSFEKFLRSLGGNFGSYRMLGIRDSIDDEWLLTLRLEANQQEKPYNETITDVYVKWNAKERIATIYVLGRIEISTPGIWPVIATALAQVANAVKQGDQLSRIAMPAYGALANSFIFEFSVALIIPDLPAESEAVWAHVRIQFKKYVLVLLAEAQANYVLLEQLISAGTTH